MSADTPDKRLDAVAFIERLVGAWDCCGTCAGGVLAERDRAVVAAERERADAATRDALLDVLAWVVDQGADDFTRSAVAHELSHRIAALGGEATP